MKTNYIRRRAFATLTAIALMGLVAVALTALAALVAHDARRTQSARCGAQLRQLLSVGAGSALDRVNAGGEAGNWSVALPSTLEAARVDVVMKGAGDAREVRVEAKMEGKRMRQVLMLTRAEGGWRCVGARIE